MKERAQITIGSGRGRKLHAADSELASGENECPLSTRLRPSRLALAIVGSWPDSAYRLAARHDQPTLTDPSQT